MRRLCLPIVLALGCGSSSGGGEAGESGTSPSDESSTGAPWEPPPGFEPFACAQATPDTGARLCPDAADPQGATDKVYIECELEGSCIGGPTPQAKPQLVVMTYNVERGLQMDSQLALFETGALPTPDVLLLIEADRGCARTQGRNVAWEYAEALSMHHVYGVEFTELTRPGADITAPCEHGNAVLSRYPIGNVRLHRHDTNLSWFEHASEPRLGGRMAILADIAVGDRLVHVQALHFESGINDGPIRAAQAAELAALGLDQPYPPIIGGDTNAGLYAFDLAGGTMNDTTVGAFFDAGYVDTHAALAPDQRATRAPGLVIDLIFVHGLAAGDAAVCPNATCGGLSDHMPVWATVDLQ